VKKEATIHINTFTLYSLNRYK